MKQRERLTEGDLHRIIKESVKRVINELGERYGKENDIDPSLHRYAFLKHCAKKASDGFRNRQAYAFDTETKDDFNNKFAFDYQDQSLNMDKNGNLSINKQNLNDDDIDYYHQTVVPNFKAGVRNKMNRGIDAYKKAKKINTDITNGKY